jgi:hypothetical protein
MLLPIIESSLPIGRCNAGAPVKLGTMERMPIIDAVRITLEYSGYHGEIKFRLVIPTGPRHRVADSSRSGHFWGPNITKCHSDRCQMAARPGYSERAASRIATALVIYRSGQRTTPQTQVIAYTFGRCQAVRASRQLRTDYRCLNASPAYSSRSTRMFRTMSPS